jgi:hypothetical protein
MNAGDLVLALAVGLLSAVTGAAVTTVCVWRAVTRRGRR